MTIRDQLHDAADGLQEVLEALPYYPEHHRLRRDLLLNGVPGVVDPGMRDVIRAAAAGLDAIADEAVVHPDYFHVDAGSLRFGFNLLVAWSVRADGVDVFGRYMLPKVEGHPEWDDTEGEMVASYQWGQRWRDGDESEIDPGAWRSIGALFTFLAQRLTVHERVRAPRSLRRGWTRTRQPEREIVVYRLRRLKTIPGAEQDEQLRQWYHRWLVSGHWRMALVGPGRSLLRPVWVSPHVKGPDGAPMLPPRPRLVLVDR